MPHPSNAVSSQNKQQKAATVFVHSSKETRAIALKLAGITDSASKIKQIRMIGWGHNGSHIQRHSKFIEGSNVCVY